MSSGHITSDAAHFLGRRADIQMRLDQARIDGGPTKALRTELLRLDREQERHETRIQVLAIDVQTAAEKVVEQAATEIVTEAVRSLTVKMAALALPDAAMVPEEAGGAIEAAAYALANAVSNVQVASNLLAAAEKARAEVQGRITTLQAEWMAIAARRRDDAPDDSDGETLATLAADLDGLKEILARDEQHVAQAKGPLAAARQHRTMMQHELQRAEDAELMRRLLAHVDRLTGPLEATLSEIEQLRTRLGTRPTWSPTHRLYKLIRHGAAVGGVL